MPENETKQFLLALARSVRVRLIDGDSVTIRGVGTLDVVHVPAETRVSDDRRQTIEPPRDEVQFDSSVR